MAAPSSSMAFSPDSSLDLLLSKRRWWWFPTSMCKTFYFRHINFKVLGKNTENGCRMRQHCIFKILNIQNKFCTVLGRTYSQHVHQPFLALSLSSRCVAGRHLSILAGLLLLGFLTCLAGCRVHSQRWADLSILSVM